MSSPTKPLGKEESWQLLGRGMGASLTFNWASKLRWTPGLQTITHSQVADQQSLGLASLICILPLSNLLPQGCSLTDKPLGT